jgi:hypothetical protein
MSPPARRIVKGLGAKSSDEDPQEPVAECPESAGMTVPQSSLTSVEGPAVVIVLDAGSRPVVDGFSKAWIAGAPHEDARRFPTATSDGSDPGVSAQRVVVSLSERLRSLAEHRGADDSSRAWNREKDLGVAMPLTFTLRSPLTTELLKDLIDPSAAIAKLLIDELEPRQQQLRMLAGRFQTPGGELKARLSQSEAQLLGGDATDAMLSQDSRELVFSEPTSLVRCRSRQKQGPQPGFVRGRTELEQLREEAMEQSSKPTGELTELFLELRIDAAQFSQSDHQRLVELELAEMAGIGPKRIRLNEGIEAVVFRAGRGVPISKAVELLGIDSKDLKPPLEQGFDDGAVSQLNGDRASVGFRVAMLQERTDKTVNPLRRMLDSKLRQLSAFTVEQADLVELTAIVDASEQNVSIGHVEFTSPVKSGPRLGAASPLYWRSRRNSPREVHLGFPRRDTGPPQVLAALGPHLVFPAGWPGCHIIGDEGNGTGAPAH